MERQSPLIKVHLLAYGEHGIREILIPPETTWDGNKGLAELAFYYGQNDFYPSEQRSVSMGDIAELPDGSLWLYKGIGTEKWTREEFQAYRELSAIAKMEIYL